MTSRKTKSTATGYTIAITLSNASELAITGTHAELMRNLYTQIRAAGQYAGYWITLIEFQDHARNHNELTGPSA